MTKGLSVHLFILIAVSGLMAASALPAAAEEMIMLRGYPNIWVPRSKLE